MKYIGFKARAEDQNIIDVCNDKFYKDIYLKFAVEVEWERSVYLWYKALLKRDPADPSESISAANTEALT